MPRGLSSSPWVSAPATIVLLHPVRITGFSGGSFGFSASLSSRVFAMWPPFRVESVSVLDWDEGSSSTFVVFGWSLSDEVTLTGRVCLRSRSGRRLRAPSLGVGAEPSRWGHPSQIRWRLSAHSIGTMASSIHLSLVASRWGSPYGSSVVFLPLDRHEVFFGYLVCIPSGWGHPFWVWI